MATPDWTKNRHLIYGSAGMAASGLMQSQDNDPESDDEDSPAVQIARRDLAGPGLLKAAVIGQGDLTTVFGKMAGVEVTAVSGVGEETENATAFDDFSALFEAEKPDLLSLASPDTADRLEIAKAALAAESHLLIEPPFARTLAEADEILANADQRGLKIAAAFPMRTDPNVLKFRDMQLRLIGELLEMRVFGKMDDTAGGEDLLTNGSHLFDLVRLFAGEVEWCSARVRKGGRDVRLDDVHQSRITDLGPLVGDGIYAHFAMDSGINVTFQSRRKMRDMAGPWGIEFIGSKSKARLFAGKPPVISLQRSPDPRAEEREDTWKRWPDNQQPYHREIEGLSERAASYRILVNDWLNAIANAKEPKSSGYRAMKALEMVHGVWQAGMSGRRAEFPLVDRGHPLGEG